MFERQERIWVAGAQGQVGSAFAQLLDRTEVELLLTDLEDVDITNADSVRTFVDMNRPQVIINCVGMTDITQCQENKDDAFRVNALGARNLSVAARSRSARLVQISTDDVFDGKNTAPYDEFDVPAPLSIYGKSKLAGENFVKEIAPKHLIIRSSWVYGNGKNFVTDVLEQARLGKEITVAGGQFASPTSAADVAEIIYTLLGEEAYGTYHATCQGYCSRFEFAKKIVELSGYPVTVKEEAPNEERVLRPSYAVLDNLMLRISGLCVPPPWEESLWHFLEQNNLIHNNDFGGRS